LTPNSYTDATDYLAYTASYFEFWRGGIKLLFHFVCSAFYSARFKIAYATTAPTTLDGDLPTMVVDVKGDTFTEVTIPYLNPLVWTYTGTFVVPPTPRLYIKMITDIQGPALADTPRIYLNIWRSGAEDIQFMGPRNPYFIYNSELRKKKLIQSVPKAQCTISTRFKSKFDPILPGSSFSGEFKTCQAELPIRISDLMKQWRPMNPLLYGSIVDSVLPWYSSDSQGQDLYNPLSFFGHLFAFWRGSRRWRFQANDGDTMTFADANLLGTEVNPPSAALTVNCSSLVRRVNDVEVPWMCQVPYTFTTMFLNLPFHHTWQLPCYGLAHQTSTFTPDTMCLAAGDDFQYLYLLPPPALISG